MSSLFCQILDYRWIRRVFRRNKDIPVKNGLKFTLQNEMNSFHSDHLLHFLITLNNHQPLKLKNITTRSVASCCPELFLRTIYPIRELQYSELTITSREFQILCALFRLYTSLTYAARERLYSEESSRFCSCPMSVIELL